MQSATPARSDIPLRMWRDLTPLSHPLRPATDNSPRVLVIGGGVTGLTTAWTLLDRGMKVTVVSKEWASNIGTHITSQIAGALWEYPPAVCGQHEGKVSLEESKRWSMVSYHCYAAVAEDPELASLSGIKMAPAKFYFPSKLEDDAVQYGKMMEVVAAGVKGFRRDPAFDVNDQDLISKKEVIKDMYVMDSPIIDTDLSMQWLIKLVQDKGGKLVTEAIQGDLLEQEDALLDRFEANVILNATGLGAEELAADASCYPVRGALLRVVNSGLDFPRIHEAHTVSADVSGAANEIIFIVPRNDNTLLLGGIAEDHVGDTDLTLDSDVIQEMYKRCLDFIPALKHAQLHPSYPLAVGLRPFRKGNVRVERELRKSQKAGDAPSRIVHSYGQGGAGWTLAFGCAADAVELINEALAGSAPRPLMLESDGENAASKPKAIRARL